MRENDQIFDANAVIEYADEHAFKQIPVSKLMDFIIVRNGEYKYIETWRKHFDSVCVPYAITRHVDHYSDRDVRRFVLWKELRI